jgi:hypothetical protein
LDGLGFRPAYYGEMKNVSVIFEKRFWLYLTVWFVFVAMHLALFVLLCHGDL